MYLNNFRGINFHFYINPKKYDLLNITVEAMDCDNRRESRIYNMIYFSEDNSYVCCIVCHRSLSLSCTYGWLWLILMLKERDR